MNEYALYKGDNLLAVGTIKEIAKSQGVKPETVFFYKSKAYKQRGRINGNKKLLIKLDESEE